MKNRCYLDAYGQVCLPSGVPLAHPAVQVIPEDDIFMHYGEYDHLVERMTVENQLLLASRMTPTMVICLESLPPDVIVYVIRRMTEYSASGFIPAFIQHASQGGCALEWLRAEMARVPIAI